MRSFWCLLTLSLLLALPGCGTGPPLILNRPGADQYLSVEPKGIRSISDDEAVVIGHFNRRDGRKEGLILITQSQGMAWKRVGHEVHDLKGVSFSVAWFADRLRGWVGGVRTHLDGRTEAIMWRTSDGGNHWREAILPIDNDVEVELLHSLNFNRSDTEGAVAVRMKHRESGEPLETAFATTNAGRAWSVAGGLYRYKPVGILINPTESYHVPPVRGWRIRRGHTIGETWVDVTGSGGKEWRPTGSGPLSLAAIDTWYGPPTPPTP